MSDLSRLIVSIQLGKEVVKLGELVIDQRDIFFRYYDNYLASGYNISPLKLKFNAEIQRADTRVFDGLFGVFADSLPDGWGRLLIDRTLVEEGKILDNISPLDRLALVGKHGMGALIYEPAAEAEKAENIFELDRLAEESQKIIAGSSEELLEELVRLGGSSGGARPKILVGYQPVTGELIYGTGDLPNGYEHWIIKFPASIDGPESAKIEFAYHQMARLAGLEMAECKLFSGASGRQYFGTKRFDRKGNERLHLHSAAGLVHDNFRLSNIDYGHLMDAAFRLKKDVRAYEKVLRLAAFNVFAHNRDDHSKNVSFLLNKAGNWRLAPAYDLTFSYSSHGYHSMTVAGEGRNPERKHLLELAETFGVNQPDKVIEKVKAAIAEWPELAQKLKIKPSVIKEVKSVITRQ